MPTVSSPSPDPVLETQVLWAKYQKTILFVLLAVIVGTLLAGGYWLYKTRRDGAAAAQLAEAKAGPAYQKVIDEYAGTPAAASAQLFLAAEQRKEKKLADANGTLQKFVKENPKHELITTAKMAMAANLDSLGKPDEALEVYGRIAADHPRSFNAPLALLAQVPLLKAKGQVDQARQVCETVMTQYRESEAVGEASRYLRTLKAPSSSTATPSPAATATP